MVRAAEVRAAQGDEGGAQQLLDRTAEFVGLTGERWCEAELSRVKARLPGFRAERPGLLRSAIAVAREQEPGCGNSGPPPTSPTSSSSTASQTSPATRSREPVVHFRTAK